MPTLADVFTPDGFSTYLLTAAIQKTPPANTYIGSLGLFREIPITGTLVAVEEQRGVLTLVPTTPRGGPGIPSHDAKRVVTPFKVPHIQLDDTIMADDVLNVRAFGDTGQAPAAEIVARKMGIMRQSVDFTNEFLRHGALQGKVYYPDNSLDANLDLFTSFGMTNQATNQTSVDFVTGTSTTDICGAVIGAINDAMEAALGGTPFTDVLALCGRTFFRKLIAHAAVKAIYAQQMQQYQLAQVGRAPNTPAPRMTLTIGNVRFVEYYNVAGAAQGIGNDSLFQTAAEARAVPLGTDLFHTYYAPADTMEAAGTLGQPMYARMIPREDGKSMGLEVQTNVLNICLRPKCLIRLHTSN